jgi:flagellar biosynthesis/type III secretory pathway chaperone
MGVAAVMKTGRQQAQGWLGVDDCIATDLLADLIGKKHAVLEQLRDLSRRQSDLIAETNMSRLLTVLSAKQTLLSELQKIQNQLEPYRQQDPESRRWRSPEDRERCSQLAQRCEALLGEIMVVEKQSEAELVQRRDDAMARLEKTHSSAQATDAYTSSPFPIRRHLDLSSDM